MQRDLFMNNDQSTAPSKSCISQEALNEAQFKAVNHGNGPLLVIAGAGSGKTRTLVYRVAYLIEQGIEPESILLLTFTRRAAQEMLWRAGRISDQSCRLGWLGWPFSDRAQSDSRRTAGWRTCDLLFNR